MASVRLRDSVRAIAEVLKRSRPPAALLGIATTTYIVVAFAGTIPPFLAARIIDALGSRDAFGALHALAWYAILTVIVAVVQFASNYLTARARERIVVNLRVALMRKLDTARFEGLSDLTLGEISNRIAGDVDMLCSQLQYSVLPTLQGIITIIATLCVMFPQNWTLTLISLGVIALLLVPVRVATPFVAVQQRKIATARDGLIGAINETASLGALTLLRDPRARARERTTFAERCDGVRRLILHQIFIGELAGFATTLIGLLGPAAILGCGTFLLVSHRLGSVGTIIAFMMYYNRLASPFSALSGLPLQLSAIAVIARRLMDVFSLKDEAGGDLPFRPGTIALRNVDVVRSERTVLDGVNLIVPHGSHVAVIGPSGSGKSTIASLLPRYYDPAKGDVSVDGTPLAHFDIESLRTGVALVSQDHLIFDMSLRENLTFVNPLATELEIDDVIEACELREVVSRLGADETLGQRGFRLSGGERARVCVARALLGHPHVLVLDEALANVEADMEDRIFQRVRRVMRGRTLLVITHRTASVRSFDTVTEVRDGRIGVAS